VVVQDLNFVEQSYYQEAGVTSWTSQSPPVGASMPQPSGAPASYIVLVTFAYESPQPSFLAVKQAEKS